MGAKEFYRDGENRDLETVRPSATIQKHDKGTMPAVTWIDMQPESSSRTSLKSFTDYLTETQDDAAVFTPPNRLRLSPETLDALDSAEKLVDDVERQLSQMQFDDSLTDDTEEDKFNDERLHVQNVVKAVFQKGYYEPAPKPVFSEGNLAWKNQPREKKPSRPKSTKIASMPINRRIEPTPVDECLLCKSNKAESAKQLRHKAEETSSSVGHVEETKINEDKPEKLNVQRGPAISIKGLLAVQTARIVDIQPAQPSVPAAGRAENIVTYECRHLETSRGASIIHENKLERDALEIRKSAVESALNYARESADDVSIVDKENRCWDECEDASLDLDEFSLREPRILVEVDAVLQQQRNIIRQVHEATDKFDKFLAKGMHDLSLEDSFENRRASKAKKSPSELGKNNAIDARHERSPSISRESLKPTESASVSRRIINGGAESNKRNSTETAPSEASDKIFREPSKLQNLTATNKSSDDEPKDTQYSENFESESSGDESKSESLKLESGIQVKNTDKEVSSNNSSFVQSSVHTQTKSDAGFIENLKSSTNLKENNLPVNLRQKTKIGRDAAATSIDSGNVDKNLHLSRDSSGNVGQKDGDERNLVEKKLNQLHVSETDDERELYSYQFDADLIEEANERTEVINKKTDEKVDDDIEFKKDRSTEKLQDNLDENSQKTSHLIDSISDISFRGSSERTKSSQESQKISFASSNSKAELPKIEEQAVQESTSELSTESKIEMKLSEARDNLKTLMKTINASVTNGADDKLENVNTVDQERYKFIEMHEKPSANIDVPQIMKNITLRSNDTRRQNSISNCANAMNQERNGQLNNRSFITLLQQNNDEVHNSFEQQKLLLLKNLESCSIHSPNRSKRLFTSTIVGDTHPPASFPRSKESSTIRQDSSSDSNSEGEIRLSSTASHSLGEIRRNILKNKSSCSTKGSTTTSSANFNSSSSRSAGEVNGLKEN